MWNVFLIDEGECTKLNSEPYDAEQIAELLERLEQEQESNVLLALAQAA